MGLSVYTQAMPPTWSATALVPAATKGCNCPYASENLTWAKQRSQNSLDLTELP